ncbi:MAG TPA: SDR family oxidoreductase [Burkholderiales bacterium]|jgi:putative NADH-flavin reductase|nr:SDR family oxidoreductase [Burkholderiales bacterium]
MSSRLLVFGASGGTGRELVSQGLDRGLCVTAFVREPTRLAVRHANLRIVQGDVGERSSLDEAVAGQDVVISALGTGRALRHDPAVVQGIRNIIQVMHDHGVSRFIYLSFIGVAESRKEAGWMLRYVARWPLRNEIADHEAKEGLVRASRLDWTIVRAPKLTNGPYTGTYRVGECIAARSALPALSRADVADFMLSQIVDTNYVGRTPRLLP